MKNILVPTDFSQQANNALTVACAIARKSGSNIHLLHVLDVSLGGGFNFSTMGEPSGYTTMDQVYVLQLRDITSQRLAELAQKNSGDGFTILPEVQVGNIFSTVTAYVKEHDIDLIVMGTKGSSGIEEFFVGSNTEKIVRRAACPVLSVKNVLPGFSIRNIAFASNFEKDQLIAVSKLKRFQELFDAQLHLVYINVPNYFVNSRAIRIRMNEFVQKYQLTNYNFAVYDDNTEEDGIIHFAEEIHADIIAVATHGRTGLAHLLSGSIAEDIVNHANRPVLTFNLREFIEQPG
ncbi:universal stress protein [Rhodocytophaga rosea]|uniref:Universal stress protein n=1 Tax=Rhodocytophaga rosea TaxID=2704465 RepID=A0A6C0GJW9_9BACT|nr:universal stress protein [Rhodocytophaga rosea]QHT67930.1 universal stress protein [Rhodocytophaga rosea]